MGANEKAESPQRVRVPPDPFRRGAGCGSFSWSGETMVEKRLPTVIVLFLFLVAISVAECLVRLLGGDL